MGADRPCAAIEGPKGKAGTGGTARSSVEDEAEESRRAKLIVWRPSASCVASALLETALGPKGIAETVAVSEYDGTAFRRTPAVEFRCVDANEAVGEGGRSGGAGEPCRGTDAPSRGVGSPENELDRRLPDIASEGACRGLACRTRTGDDDGAEETKSGPPKKLTSE